ncbi:glycosyltransferase [Echinicola strongylocentroti]|uniref:Glycosyltransferase n=1 Tax=Echinicola strongylocentroti TaxID=1795355 RepID=A0A2Z4IME4_9BACT|nr:glycosyltransferase [Echinicola strongylocentroti]AWW32065.1 glycosyltransferase [Echinicola strongylocentroti]
MRIVHLIQKPQLRGAELFAAQLAQCQMRNGHEVLLVCVFRGKASFPFEGEIVCIDCKEKNRFWEIRGWRRLRDIIAHFRPDIVQANASDTLKFSVFSKMIFKWDTPIVYRNANKISDFIKGKSHLTFNKFLFSKINGVISVSIGCNQDFNHCFNSLNIPNCTIPNGVDFGEMDRKLQDEVPNTLREKEYVLMVGAFVKEKNHIGLLHIFNEIHKKFPQLYLVFVGAGKLAAEINSQAANMESADRVLFMGNLDNVLPVMKNAKALLVPSKIEGLPAVILESMYCKVPVIAYDVGGISEAVLHDETGFLVPFENRNLFRNLLERVLSDNHRIPSDILDNARTKVITHFNINVLAHYFLTFYQQITDTKRA